MTESSASPAPRAPSSRYALLDPLRGVASLTVVLDHAAGLKIGYHAVLVFFVISGYCILASAESGLRRGMTIATYMGRRLRRIYPPYIISVAFFVATRLAKWALGGELDLAKRTPLMWLQTFTLTQWMSIPPAGADYAFNNPTLFVAAHWSLNYEEQFYLFVGLSMVLCVRFGLSLRSVLLPFTVATLALMAARPQLCQGFFVDYWPLFGVGVAVYYRVVGAGDARVRRGIDAALLGLFLVSAWLTWHGVRAPQKRYIWEDLLVASTVALFLVAMKAHEAGLMKTLPLRLLKKIGTVSYSLYLIHQFNITLAASVAGRVVSHARFPVANVALQLAVHVAMAAGFWWLFERPFLNPPVEEQPAAVMVTG
jgi:peptidoglycan/LPS O-acetylase OafA/YrhL